MQLDLCAQRERESLGQLGHARPKGADPPAQVVGRHLKTKQSSGFARQKLDQALAIEAKRTLLELLDHVVGDAGLGRQWRHDLAASHEALGAVLDDEAVPRFTRELATDPRVRLEQADLVTEACAP